MKTPLIVIAALVIAIIIVYFIARARVAKNMRVQLKPYELEPGSTRPFFEGNGVKYDEEKYMAYLSDYASKMPDAQIAFTIAQRGKRTDVWNVKFCEALRIEQERRDALKKASGEIDGEADEDEYDEDETLGDDKEEDDN
ncbi:hypothetical protein SDC9_157632 [bioreactor metagenome]|uniref:Uncharacterized protein n=1 Tax=bioreactor metagenome TaxID=1076179 RepID=A0A645F7Y4_9ZZZZ|nr:hypothetical protein [Oscillospiraceae bacterium]